MSARRQCTRGASIAGMLLMNRAGSLIAGLGVAVALLLAFVPVASASPILLAQAFNGGTLNGGSNAVGPISASQETTGTVCSAGQCGTPVTGDAIANATANYGTLKASSSSTRGYLESGLATFTDTFTMTGAPAGTALDYLVTYQTDGSLSFVNDLPGPSAGGSAFSDVRTWLTGLPGAGGCVDPGGAEPPACNVSSFSSVTWDGSTLSSVADGSLTGSFEVSLLSGTSYTITQGLEVASTVTGDYTASTAAQYGDTEQFFLTPVTPGAGFTTLSGATYDLPSGSAVPEPSSLVLLGIGLTAASLWWRRRVC
jgi:hypothetical protein